MVLDLKMPRKGVLLCSGYGENEEVQGLISLCATGLLSKPCRIGELSEHLARFGV